MMNLEVKVAFIEHQVAQLDEIIRGMRDQLDEMRQEISSIREETIASAAPIENTKPPHY